MSPTYAPSVRSAAETLREAARLMRERAEVATPGPWAATRLVRRGGYLATVVHDRSGANEHGRFVLADGDREARMEDAAHIASWHPAVGLAVADWLDAAAEDAAMVDRSNARTAERAARTGGDGHTWVMHHALVGPALTVAQAYLGGAP